MQKNTLLAIFLSIAVLFGYEAIMVAPKRAEMLKNAQAAKNKELVEKNPTSPSAKPAEAVVVEKTTLVVKEGKISHIKTTNDDIYLTTMGGSLHKSSINHKEMPFSGVLGIVGLDQEEYVLLRSNNKESVYAYTNADWQITKSFVLQDEHSIKSRMEIKNISGKSRMEDFKFIVLGLDTSRMDISHQADSMLEEYSINVGGKIIRKGSSSKFNTKNNDKQGDGQIRWAAFRNHYNAFVVRPDFETKSYEIKSVTESKLNISIAAKQVTLEPNQSISYEFTIYAGPQDINLMKKYGGDIEKAVAFFNWAFFNWIALGFYHIIAFFYSIIKNWGVAIILFSTLIYGATYPLTIKSMLSMRRMQEMQPKIVALRERYKSDPQKLNTETMEMYRREKINPLGGCLPMLLQMPIFIAVYQVIWRAQYFEYQGFLWIKDLAQPDQLFMLPFTIPFMGNQFNILPLLMGVLMFAQQKIAAKSMVITDETQLMQQKMMTIVMPVFMAVIFYKFASSLSLYFIMFYLFSAATQWKMSKLNTKK